MRKIEKKMTIRLLVLFLGISLSIQTFSQTENCWSIKVEKKDISDTNLLSEYFNAKGLYLVENGIYNFKINGTKYFMHRIVSIKMDSLTIVFGADLEPEFTFPVNAIEKLTFYSLDNGRVGFPHNILKPNKFDFETVQTENICAIKKAKIYIDRERKEYIEGYQYMTAGYGWKPVYKENGKTHLLDKSIIHEIKNK